MTRAIATIFGLTIAIPAFAQLSLEDALRAGLAKNGTLVASRFSLQAARYRLTQSQSAFFPSITLSGGYQDQQQSIYSLPVKPRATNTAGATGTGSATWRLLDTGERSNDLKGSLASLHAQELNTLNTARQTLVNIYSQYYEVLRSIELERVSTVQAERAGKVVEQTKAQVRVGDAAEKDIYQPLSDELNAKVSAISAKATKIQNLAQLRALLGWEGSLELAPSTLNDSVADVILPSLESEIKSAMVNRADLIALRQQAAQQKFNFEKLKIAAGFSLAVDASFNRNWGTSETGGRTLTALVSYPVFDGGLTRARANEAKSTYQSSLASLQQSERSAQADVETNYNNLLLNVERVKAAVLAVEAAKVNYEKTVLAKKLGATGSDIVAISTAQVSLVTAETNLIQARYDLAISRAKYKLAIGAPVPGEELVSR